RWENVDPFGANSAEESPSGAAPFVFNLRLPGQYFDAETGTHHNYHRDYDPKIGRYVESDPIGLRGGINTYEYVRSNSLRWIDPLGLFEMDASCNNCPDKERIENQLKAECANIDNTITDVVLANCMKERCKTIKVKCQKGCFVAFGGGGHFKKGEIVLCYGGD